MVMKTFWDQSHDGSNFGDALNVEVFRRLAGIELEWSEPEDADLFGIGSIAEAIPKGFPGIVLGTGKMFEESVIDLSSARVLALRGPLTGQSDLYADLGLLASDLTQTVSRDVAVGWLPHYVDERLYYGERIDILAGVDSVIAAVARCKRLVSSSLHGLILADALGIENLWEPHHGVLGKGFKFRDYASSYGETITPGVWRLADREQVVTKQQALRSALETLT
jgi:hypothetical protein